LEGFPPDKFDVRWTSLESGDKPLEADTISNKSGESLWKPISDRTSPIGLFRVRCKALEAGEFTGQVR
jgi:hypothetical protein